MPLTLISSQALLRVLGLWPSMLQWPAKHIRSAAFSQGLCRRLPEVQLQHLEVARLLLDARADPDHPTCRGDRGRFSPPAASPRQEQAVASDGSDGGGCRCLHLAAQQALRCTSSS